MKKRNSVKISTSAGVRLNASNWLRKTEVANEKLLIIKIQLVGLWVIVEFFQLQLSELGQITVMS